MEHYNLVAPPRSRWGTPQVDGSWKWTRPSTLAKACDDTSNLIDWKARTCAKGIVSQEHLIAAASAASIDDKGAWRDILEQGLTASGGTKGRTMGTAVHTATEEADYGRDISHLPEGVFNDVQAYRSQMRQRNFEPLAAELFVVNDELKAAGSFDRLILHPPSERAAILDLKTSSNPSSAKWSAVSWAIQLAVYANSVPYCHERGRLSWGDLGLPTPNTDYGVIAHIVPGSSRCKFLKVDLKAGLEYARLATEVREARKDTNIVEEM